MKVKRSNSFGVRRTAWPRMRTPPVVEVDVKRTDTDGRDFRRHAASAQRDADACQENAFRAEGERQVVVSAGVQRLDFRFSHLLVPGQDDDRPCPVIIADRANRNPAASSQRIDGCDHEGWPARLQARMRIGRVCGQTDGVATQSEQPSQLVSHSLVPVHYEHVRLHGMSPFVTTGPTTGPINEDD